MVTKPKSLTVSVTRNGSEDVHSIEVAKWTKIKDLI
jgi:hypothetical protein